MYLLFVVFDAFRVFRQLKPYVQIRNQVLHVQFSLLKTTLIPIHTIAGLEQKKKQLSLYLKNSSEKQIFLHYIKASDSEDLVMQLSAVVRDNALLLDDLLLHLIEH